MLMCNTAACIRTAIEDDHIPIPQLLKDTDAGLKVVFVQQVPLASELSSMQDHLRPQPAVLVQDELVRWLNLAQRELRVIVEKSWFAGFVPWVVGLGSCYWRNAEVDIERLLCTLDLFGWLPENFSLSDETIKLRKGTRLKTASDSVCGRHAQIGPNHDD